MISTGLCILAVSILPVLPFFSRSPLPEIANAPQPVQKHRSDMQRDIKVRAAREQKERQLQALREQSSTRERYMHQNSLIALQDRILMGMRIRSASSKWSANLSMNLANQIWRLEREIKELKEAQSKSEAEISALRERERTRPRKADVKGGVVSRSKYREGSRVITSSEGSKVSWRALLSVAVNPCDSPSESDAQESEVDVDELVEELVGVLQSKSQRMTAPSTPKSQRLPSITEEQSYTPSTSSSSSSDYGMDEDMGSSSEDETFVEYSTSMRLPVSLPPLHGLPVTPPPVQSGNKHVYFPLLPPAPIFSTSTPMHEEDRQLAIPYDFEAKQITRPSAQSNPSPPSTQFKRERTKSLVIVGWDDDEDDEHRVVSATRDPGDWAKELVFEPPAPGPPIRFASWSGFSA